MSDKEDYNNLILLPNKVGNEEYYKILKMRLMVFNELSLFIRHPDLLKSLTSEQRNKFFEFIGDSGSSADYLKERSHFDEFPESVIATKKALHQESLKTTVSFVQTLESFTAERLSARPAEKELLADAMIEHLSSSNSMPMPDEMLEYIKTSKMLNNFSGEKREKILKSLYENFLVKNEETEIENFKNGSDGADAIEPDANVRERIIKEAMLNSKSATAPISMRALYIKELGKEKANQLLEQAAHKKDAIIGFGDVLDVHIPDKERFQILDPLSTNALYFIANNSRDAVFPSSYHGIMKRFTQRLDDGNQRIPDILDDAEQKTIPHFLLQVAASSQEPEKILKYIPAEKMPELLKGMVAEVATNNDDLLRNSTGLVEWMETLKKINPQWAKILEDEVRNRAENAKDARERAGFEKIAAVRQSSFSGTVGNQDFFQKSLAKYSDKMGDNKRISSEKLTDNTGAVRVRYVFHYDESDDHKDAQNSYNSFMSNHVGWKKEEHDNYVVLSKEINGVPVLIYANKAGEENREKGQAAISERVKNEQTKDGKAPSEPYFTMFVNRGHIGHLDEALPYMGKETPIVFDGSCFGSGQDVANIKKTSQKANIIATKGEGTMNVNEPLLNIITNEIAASAANKQNLVWDIVRSNNKMPTDKRMQDYVFPDQNNALLLMDLFAEKIPETTTTPPQRQIGGFGR